MMKIPRKFGQLNGNRYMHAQVSAWKIIKSASKSQFAFEYLGECV